MSGQLNDVEACTVERIGKRLLPIQNDPEIRRLKDANLRSFPRRHLPSALNIEVVLFLNFIALGADETKQHFYVSIDLLEAIPVAQSREMV